MRNMIWRNEINIVNNQKISAYHNLDMRSVNLFENDPVSESQTFEGYKLKCNYTGSQDK
jgi:hypothetical protein